MLISLLLITILTLGGMSLTYLLSDDKPLMWRLAAGNIVGSAIFGTLAFAVACLVGLSGVTIIASLLVTLTPLLLFLDNRRRGRLKNDWAKAKGKLQGGGVKRFRGFAYYAFFFILFWLFFQQVMFELKDGIYTGGSNNLGDLPFHLGAILRFTDGNNFPPQNPSWAGARFSCPFIADFLTACFVKLGAEVKDAMFLQDMSWAMSLLVIVERFAARLTGSKLAGRIAPALLVFSGGLGFVWFLKDWWTGSAGLWNILWHLPRDYTINNDFRWGNSMVVLFITQRSLLLGMPLTVLVLGWLWKVFSSEKVEEGKSEKVTEGSSSIFTFSHFHFFPLAVGLLAGTLPLIHLHSLAVLFVVTAFLFILRPAKWRTWVTFGVGVALVAVPELLWSMSGSATETSKFFGWNWGWDKNDEDYFSWFWFKNTGFVIPMIVAAVYILFSPQRRRDAEKVEVKVQKEKGKTVGEGGSPLSTFYSPLLLFYIPFAFLFILSNIAKLAPWEWDNIKLLIYWYVASVPLIAYVLVWVWEKKGAFKFVAAFCLVVLIFAGALDVWRTASGQNKIKVFDREAMQLGEQLKTKTDPHAVFLNAPTYNSAIVLSGRESVMRYSGHLASHGIDFGPREDDVKRIYAGGGVAEILLRKYNVDYVLISPEERNTLQADENFFSKFPVIAEAGQYRVYKVK
jgi:hypothetical protein